MTGAAKKPGRRRRARATRFALGSTLTILALTAACVLAVLIAGRHKLRLDVTAAGEHSLAPRTRSLLASLEEPVGVVLSANLQRLDRRVRQRLDDALGAFADGSPRLTIMRIDTGSAGAQEGYAQLVAELAARDAQAIEGVGDAAARSLDDLDRLARSLADLGARCREIGEMAPEEVGAQWEEAAGVLRALAGELGGALEVAGQRLATPYAGVALPEADAILREIDPIVQRIARALGALQSHASGKGSERLGPEARPLVAQTGDAARDLLQLAADALDRLRRAPRLDALDVARLLAQREAVVVVGPERVAAVDFDALFPAAGISGGADGAPAASLVFAGEDLIATAIAAATRRAQPGVVLVHAETERVFDKGGEPTASAGAALGSLIGSLRLRQITVAEWPVALDVPMPGRAAIGVGDDAPLVWFVLDAPPSSAPEGVARIGKLGDAARRVIDRGESLLLTVGPSELPSVGEANPLAEALSSFGLRAESGHVVIGRLSTPTGPQFMYSHTIRRAAGDHLIGAALDALSTLLPAPIPIRIEGAGDVTAWPILSIEAGEGTWAESRWQNLLAQRAGGEPPTPDPRQDILAGPFHAVVAAQRSRAPTDPAAIRSGTGGIQRLVCVGARSWYVDPIAAQRIRVEGREVARYPGNRELLAASIAWLAGQDELIARSPEVAEVARIKPLAPGQVAAIRWFLIAGMPALVLGIGAAMRLIRR